MSKEYIALLHSGKLDVYNCKRGFNSIEELDDLAYDLNSTGISYWMQSVDSEMIKTGFRSFITLESEDTARRFYLCKKLKKLPNSVHNALFKYLDLFYSKEKSTPGFNKYAYDDELGCASLEIDITETPDNKDALSINSSILSGEGLYEEYDTVSFSKEDFYNKNISSEYLCFVDMVNSVLKEFSSIVIDKLSLFMASNLAVDFKNEHNKEAFSYFIGISRMYERNWWVTENPDPITDDTYEICIMVVPTYSPCVVKRKDFYKSLLEYINSNDCDIDWAEIEDENGNVIGYKNSFCKLMKNDTVESLIAKDMNYIKKVNKK